MCAAFEQGHLKIHNPCRQIAFVLSFLSPLCQAEFSATCPSAKASKGCYAKDHNYDAACAKVSDETACGKQIACHWSDGPVSGAVYSAFDDFLNIDVDFYNCYQSNSLSALIAHMATLKDRDVERAQYHHKRPPVVGACNQCWYEGKYQWKFPYSKVVAPGITEFSRRKLNMATSAVEVQAAPTGKYTASVPFILDMTLNFNDDGTMDFDNNVKIAHQEINCPKTKVAISDTAVTFPNIGNTGDCMGDALRGQKKDVTKFKVDINSDGTLTFHSDGWPDLKLQKKSLAVSTLSGQYEGSVPFILDMKLNFPGDGTMNFDQNVMVAHQEIRCPTEKIAETATSVTFPNIANTGDCMGDALRGQKKDVSKFTIDINSDGSLTFHSDGWPDLKLSQKALSFFIV